MANVEEDLIHCVMCMDRSCRRCNEIANRYGLLAPSPSPGVTSEQARAGVCSVCGSNRIPINREGTKFGACTFINCDGPTVDYERESGSLPARPELDKDEGGRTGTKDDLDDSYDM